MVTVLISLVGFSACSAGFCLVTYWGWYASGSLGCVYIGVVMVRSYCSQGELAPFPMTD